MKRSFWALLIVLVLGLFGFSKTSPAKIYTRPVQELTASNAVDQSSLENERTKELLEIWKDHVRTLTKERDEAYKEIEDLKSQGGVSPPPKAQDTMIDTEKEDAVREVEKELDAKNKTLLQENSKLKSDIKNAAAEKQKQGDLEQELAQLKSENDRLQKTRIQQSKIIHTLKSTSQSLNDRFRNAMTQQSKIIDMLKSTIQSFLDSLGSNSDDQRK